MLYCNKCSRLLDEDVTVCPYCGNFLDSVYFGGKRQISRQREGDSTLRAINCRADQGKRWQFSQYEPSPGGQRLEKVISDFEVRSAAVYRRQSSPKIYRGAYRYDSLNSGKKPGWGFKAGMLVLSVLLTVPSLIISIMLRRNKDKELARLGFMMMVASILATFGWILGYIVMQGHF
jgi:hypothetical protein